MSSPLAIIPTYINNEKSLELVANTARTLRITAPKLDILMVDDKSPHQSLLLDGIANGVSAKLIKKVENTGFSDTVNVGLEQALEQERDAILINADMEFVNTSWLPALQDTPASVVGGLLTYANGLVQHAGVFYSILRREHDHRYRMSPSTLNVVHEEIECPVTGALMYIRSECLNEVGLMDTNFGMGWEDVDYCIRVFESGRKCVYQPKAQVVHHESMFRRGKNTFSQKRFEDGLHYLRKKHAGKDMSQYCPTMIEWPTN